MRDNFILRCTECGEENYLGNKNNVFCTIVQNAF